MLEWPALVPPENVYVLDNNTTLYYYTARSYIRVLEANLYSIWEPGLEFMQDNAPIYGAGLVRK